MKPEVLVDTGPLVALLNPSDHFHVWVKEQMASISPPLLTCEAVLSESCFLLAGRKGGTAVIELLRKGVVTLKFSLPEHIGPVVRLLDKYSDQPMSLADACLVRMAEVHTDSKVFTLDNDFTVYRKHGRQVIPTIMPGRR